MANTKISALTSGSALALTDIFPAVETAGTGPVQKTGATLASGLLGSSVLSGQTVTTSNPVLNLSQTWNAGAVAFTGLKFNATDTASASGSLLLDLQVGGVSKFNISKIGSLTAAGSISAYSSGLWSVSDSGGIFLGASSDVVLKRDAANTLALRNGANVQTFNLYGTYTDASNYERLSFTFGSLQFKISAENAGTGAARSLKVGVGGAADGITVNSDKTVSLYSSLSAPSFISAGSYFQAGTGIAMPAGGWIQYNAGMTLIPDTANQLALRNGGSAQQFNVYNTYTDNSNYERGGLYWSAGAFTLGTQSAGTGGARAVQLISSSSVYVQTNGGSGPYWMFDTGGNLKAGVDGSYDIGASGANRARNAYLAGNIVTGSTTLHETSVALTNGAAAATGTLTNAPVAGNPTKWFPINDNGTTRYVPAW